MIKDGLFELVEILCDCLEVQYYEKNVVINPIYKRSRFRTETNELIFGTDVAASGGFLSQLRIISHEVKHYEQLIKNLFNIDLQKYEEVNVISISTEKGWIMYQFENEVDAETFAHVFVGYIAALRYDDTFKQKNPNHIQAIKSYEALFSKPYNISYTDNSELGRVCQENLNTCFNDNKDIWISLFEKERKRLKEWVVKTFD